MAHYTLITSRDPFDSKETQHYLTLAAELGAAGNEVTVFLVQNGVLAARPSAVAKKLSALAAGGVRVLADSFSLRERGISVDRLAERVQAADIDVVVDHLAAGRKVIWH